MARILAYTSPARGHLYPLTGILLELAARGHDVAVRTLAADVPLLRSLGLGADALTPALEAMPHDDWRARSARQGLVRSVRTFAARAPHDAADLRAALDAVRPDVVVVDVNTWGAAAVAEASGLPWAMFCPYPIPLPSRDVPPFGPGLPPAAGPLGRLRDAALRPVVVGAYERAILPPLNAVRRELGVPALRGAGEIFARPPVLLYLTGEPFEYPRSDWPDGVVQVGACDWEPPTAAPEWLDEVDRPLVLVTTSSEFQDDGRLVRAALEGLTDGFTVVATVPAGDPAGFTVPPGARVERFVSHAPLLERSVVAVTHGGMGATQKALVRGVPVVAVPFGRDQAEVARRVEVSGAGVRLPARRLTPARLRAAVEEAVGRADRARALAGALAALGGPVAAADAVERRLLGARSLG